MAGEIGPVPPTCAKCGACSTVCPVYRQTGREYHTGRGKLHLLARMDPASASAAYAEILSHCLLCGACSHVCTRAIPVAERLAAARAELHRRAGKQVLLRALGGKLLGQPRLLQVLAPLARMLKERRLPADSGLNLRLGLDLAAAAPGGAAPRATREPGPDLDAGPGQRSLPASEPAPANPAALYLFSGCYANFIEPEIAQAVSSLLTKNGLGQARPATDVDCCGLAAYSSGQAEQARRLARRNIAAHQGSAPIVVACASCAAHLRRYAELLADDPDWREPAADFVLRIREFSQYIHQATNQAPAAPAGEQEPLKVLYHDPCHLRFGSLRIEAEPRQLLQRIPGLELTELPRGPQCCGQGGLFHLAHPASSAAILEQLTSDFRQSGAEVVTTACSGCLLHWQQARADGQHQARVLHLAVLLDRLLPPLEQQP